MWLLEWRSSGTWEDQGKLWEVEAVESGSPGHTAGSTPRDGRTGGECLWGRSWRLEMMSMEASAMGEGAEEHR